MNLVAHQFLSFNNPSIQIGNLLGEIVKGNKFNTYPTDIKKGILLHREIDSYTDSHEIVKRSTTYFHTTHHKYSPIIVDLLYDYFLIKHWRKYHPTSFYLFKQNCYELFIHNYDNFPAELQYMLDYMLKQDWFENYSSLEGIQKTLIGLSKRTKFVNNLGNSLPAIQLYENEIEQDFLEFFPDLINHCQRYIKEN